MEWILLVITVPIFYVIGLTWFIRWLVQRNRQPAKPDFSSVGAELRLRATRYDGTVRSELLEVADSLAGPLPDHHSGAAPKVHPASPKSSWAHMDISDAMHSLDNINLLLYLGAFLIVVSAGIFVGYNFTTLSGGFKTGFLALFATVFYVTGLALFLRTPKLRPAGTTFTGIGLVLVPLVGLAAYNFTSAHDYGSAIWFVTSLITLVLYIVTLAATRQTYIAYLMAFTTLSLFESGISVVNMPVYWFGWGMAAVSIILAAVGRWRGWWKEAAESFIFSANIFVPISLLLSITIAPDNGLTQLGVTLGLSGLFYAYMASRFAQHKYGAVYWIAALVCLPAALGVGLWDSLGQSSIAIIITIIAFAYLGLGRLARDTLTKDWQKLLGLVASLLPVVSYILSTGVAIRMFGYLLATALIGAIFALWLRQSALALIAILAAIAAPYVLLHEVFIPPLSAGWGAATYLALALVMVWWRGRMRGWNKSSDAVGKLGYLLAFAIAVFAATVSGHLTLLFVGAATASALYALSYQEKSGGFIYLASAIKYLAAAQIVPLTNWPHSAYALVIIAVGSASYSVGYTMTDQVRGRALRYSAIMATLLGSVFGISGDALAPIASLALGGGLLFVEARRQSLAVVEELAIGVEILAINWFLGYNSVSQTQAFTLPWAGYIAFLGYRRRSRGHEVYDLFVAGALAMLTFPIAGQALMASGQLYGLELIFIGLALVLVGNAIRYRLVAWWGAATLVAEVLYQMKDFLYGLPKYFISAALGLALLATAIVLLQRRRQ